MRRNTGLLGLVAMAALTAGCGASPVSGEEVASTHSAALTSADILGFETTAGWSTSAGVVSLSAIHTQGSSSMAVSNIGYVSLTSARMASPAEPSSTVSYDLLLPTNQLNPWWYGSTQL